MKTLIQNGTVVRGQGVEIADVLIENGFIKQVSHGITQAADEVIEARGKFVFAGFIDTHTHFDLDLGVTVTADNFVTGTRAAALGGTTTVLDFATQDRGMTMQDAFELWQKKARGSSCNYGFHMAISEWNGERAAEVEQMVAQGVTSFKMYMVYDAMRLNDGEIYAALKHMAALGCIAGVHCENFDILNERIHELNSAGIRSPLGHPLSRPNEVEAEAVARLMRIGELAHSPVWVVHLSTKEGLEEALRARARGQEVYLETCPQYLVLDDSCYAEPDAEKFIMSPPLRKKADQDSLFSAMRENEIDVIGTDHCSFFMNQKALGGGEFSKTPNGGAGVQNRAQLIYTYAVKTGKITLPQMASLMSENAARLFGIAPHRGVLAEGAEADITIYNPEGESKISFRTNAHHCDNSPYEGMKVSGSVSDVLLGGKHIVKNGELVLEGKGRYVFRKTGVRYRS
ncbi:MAG: dihydropyrimidinase [Eubacteriales bacterium]|nr:dihydropyrimidinase [Eubacteriales bacterium]